MESLGNFVFSYTFRASTIYKFHKKSTTPTWSPPTCTCECEGVCVLSGISISEENRLGCNKFWVFGLGASKDAVKVVAVSSWGKTIQQWYFSAKRMKEMEWCTVWGRLGEGFQWNYRGKMYNFQFLLNFNMILITNIYTVIFLSCSNIEIKIHLQTEIKLHKKTIDLLFIRWESFSISVTT